MGHPRLSAQRAARQLCVQAAPLESCNYPRTPCSKHLHVPPGACRPPRPWPGLPQARRLQRCPWPPVVRVCTGAASTTKGRPDCPAQTQGHPVWPLQPQPGSLWDGAHSQDEPACHGGGKTPSLSGSSDPGTRFTLGLEGRAHAQGWRAHCVSSVQVVRGHRGSFQTGSRERHREG